MSGCVGLGCVGWVALGGLGGVRWVWAARTTLLLGLHPLSGSGRMCVLLSGTTFLVYTRYNIVVGGSEIPLTTTVAHHV